MVQLCKRRDFGESGGDSIDNLNHREGHNADEVHVGHDFDHNEGHKADHYEGHMTHEKYIDYES